MTQRSEVDPDDPSDAVLYLRAEGTLGLVRSALVVVGCVVAGISVATGSLSVWWLLALVPLGLFNAVEVIGWFRHRRLTRGPGR